jgi:prophage antirepressor-like protein
MNTDIQIFKNPKFGEVRVVEIEGKTYFAGNDVANALGYTSPKDAISRHCKGATFHRLSDNQGFMRDTKVIPEGDIYRLAAKSELPGAEAFESWIFDEVLPSIRRTGSYLSPQISSLGRKELAQMIIEAEEEKERLQLTVDAQTNELKKQAPKVEYFDEVLQSGSLIATNVIAKQLGMSAVTLNKKLHEKCVIYKCNGTWVMYEKHQDKGYTDTKTHVWTDSHGNEQTHIQTYWTEKRRMFIHGLFRRVKVT